MNKISKALGAGVGGALAGTVALPFMPDDTPWWGYLAAYAVVSLLPAIVTYFAPKNAE